MKNNLTLNSVFLVLKRQRTVNENYGPWNLRQIESKLSLAYPKELIWLLLGPVYMEVEDPQIGDVTRLGGVKY